MAKAAATWLKHSQNPILWVLLLLICLWSTVQADAHILSCSFTVKTRSIRTESIQCSVNGMLLDPYDKDKIRKEGSAPKECAYLFSKLKDIGDELRNQLFTMEEEGVLTRGNHSLLVTVVSLYKEGQPIDGYCSFTLDVHNFFGFNRYDSKNKKWAVTHNNTPGIDKWQNNTELAQLLATFIEGDFGRCFQEILLHLKKMARPTSRATDIGNVTSSPSQLPSTMNTTQLPSTMNSTQLPSTVNTTQLLSTKQPPSNGGSTVTVVLIVISFVIILSLSFCIRYMCVMRNSPQGGEMCCICGNRRGQYIQAPP